MSIGGGVAKLTLSHLNKDDEGLYTLRIWTKDGTTEHSAYLFVKGKKISDKYRAPNGKNMRWEKHVFKQTQKFLG